MSWKNLSFHWKSLFFFIVLKPQKCVKEQLWKVVKGHKGLGLWGVYEGLWGVIKGYEGFWRVMKVLWVLTVFTTFQPKLKGVCPKGVGPTPSACKGTTLRVLYSETKYIYNKYISIHHIYHIYHIYTIYTIYIYHIYIYTIYIYHIYTIYTINTTNPFVCYHCYGKSKLFKR